jgi:hypothetical protein
MTKASSISSPFILFCFISTTKSDVTYSNTTTGPRHSTSDRTESFGARVLEGENLGGATTARPWSGQRTPVRIPFVLLDMYATDICLILFQSAACGLEAMESCGLRLERVSFWKENSGEFTGGTSPA